MMTIVYFDRLPQERSSIAMTCWKIMSWESSLDACNNINDYIDCARHHTRDYCVNSFQVLNDKRWRDNYVQFEICWINVMQKSYYQTNGIKDPDENLISDLRIESLKWLLPKLWIPRSEWQRPNIDAVTQQVRKNWNIIERRRNIFGVPLFEFQNNVLLNA